MKVNHFTNYGHVRTRKEQNMAIEGNQAATIHGLRFGYKNIEDFDDCDIEAIMDYCLPHDVMSLCITEIARRRCRNLASI